MKKDERERTSVPFSVSFVKEEGEADMVEKAAKVKKYKKGDEFEKAEIECPNCEQTVKVGYGKNIPCPNCGEKMNVLHDDADPFTFFVFQLI